MEGSLCINACSISTVARMDVFMTISTVIHV